MPPTGDPFLVDDDGGVATSYIDEPPGSLAPAFLTSTPNYFQYAGGIKRCISPNCNNNVNESLSHYWHIHPPAGLCPGTWNATLDYFADPLSG